MEKKNIDWSALGFGYIQTDKRFVSNYKNGAWDEGVLTDDATVVISECAGVLQYSQSCFEGLKAYTTQDGHIVCFRPDLNASRMKDSCERLEMPVFPEDRWVQAVVDVVKANAAYVPPYGSGATLYIRPYMFGSSAVIGVKPAEEYQFRIFTTPVGPYFKGGAKLYSIFSDLLAVCTAIVGLLSMNYLMTAVILLLQFPLAIIAAIYARIYVTAVRAADRSISMGGVNFFMGENGGAAQYYQSAYTSPQEPDDSAAPENISMQSSSESPLSRDIGISPISYSADSIPGIVPDEPALQEETECPMCGRKNPEEESFCKGCGYKLR